MFHPDGGRLDLRPVTLDGGVTLMWGDGEYRFRLAYGQLQELEEACGGVGTPVIADAMVTRTFRVRYVRETLRLGLIGGGMAQSEALKCVRRFVESFEGGGDYWTNAKIAYVVINAALKPPEDARALGKALGTRKRAKRVPPETASTSPASSPPA